MTDMIEIHQTASCLTAKELDLGLRRLPAMLPFFAACLFQHCIDNQRDKDCPCLEESETDKCDATLLLPDVVLEEIVRFVGEGSYRSVAGTCRRFRDIYREVYGTCTTSAEEMVCTVSGAKLFRREARAESVFWIRRKGTSAWDYRIEIRSDNPLSFVGDVAALNGRLEVLKWAIAQGYPLPPAWLAAYGGNLTMLKWMRWMGCPWDFNTCYRAARMGHLKVLQWARRRGCPWNFRTCVGAAYGGHLTLLQWARQHDCPWNEEVCSGAAAGGHLTLLQWARQHGCRWSVRTCPEAAAHGHLDILQWARANDCYWDSDTCAAAAAGGHLDILQWAHANGCPWDERTCTLAGRYGHLAVLQWARQHGWTLKHAV